jgi:hypothetical protein
VRLRLLRRDLEARIKILIRHEHVQGGVKHHERDPHRVHDAHGVEQGHAGHLLQQRGGEAVWSQRRHLVAQGEQVVNAWRSRLLVMVHDGSLSLRQHCHGSSFSGEEYPWRNVRKMSRGEQRGSAHLHCFSAIRGLTSNYWPRLMDNPTGCHTGDWTTLERCLQLHSPHDSHFIKNNKRLHYNGRLADERNDSFPFTRALQREQTCDATGGEAAPGRGFCAIG